MTQDLHSLFAADPRPLMSALHIRYDRANAWFCPFCQSAGPGKHKDGDFKIHGAALNCFKCGGSWDAFKLVMEVCKVDFKEAKRIVAGAYGMGGATGVQVQAAARQAKPAKKHRAKGYPNLEAAVQAWLDKHPGWSEWKRWRYSDALFVLRMQSGEDKDYRPFRRRSTGDWVAGMPKPPRPLYGLDTIGERKERLMR